MVSMKTTMSTVMGLKLVMTRVLQLTMSAVREEKTDASGA